MTGPLAKGRTQAQLEEALAAFGSVTSAKKGKALETRVVPSREPDVLTVPNGQVPRPVCAE